MTSPVCGSEATPVRAQAVVHALRRSLRAVSVEMSGTVASSAGYPTGNSTNGRSLVGQFRMDKKRMGLGVCVKVTRPMVCNAAINRSHAMPQLAWT